MHETKQEAAKTNGTTGLTSNKYPGSLEDARSRSFLSASGFVLKEISKHLTAASTAAQMPGWCQIQQWQALPGESIITF